MDPTDGLNLVAKEDPLKIIVSVGTFAFVYKILARLDILDPEGGSTMLLRNVYYRLPAATQ